MSRGMPIAKAIEEHTLLAFGMNGEPLPFLHGGPAAPDRAGLARLAQPEMAHPHLDPRPGA